VTHVYHMNVHLQLETDVVLPVDRLYRAVEWVLAKHDVKPGTGLSIVVGSDDDVRHLNRQYRAVDAPTDVLSFPADPSPVPDEEPYLGDLILALPYIQRQADAEGHALSDVLVLTVIHGALHLLGYDHDMSDNQAAMWAVQAEALAALDVAITVPLFEFPAEDDDNQPGGAG
jgi:probable rRNA maturation factor